MEENVSGCFFSEHSVYHVCIIILTEICSTAIQDITSTTFKL